MRFDEAHKAVEEAKATLRAVDGVADKLADMLVGRLRKVSGYTLKQLKAELRFFDSRTARWRTPR